MTAIALDPINLPLHGLRLIEASAGTGKTWTIAALYLRLVLGHGEHDGISRRPLLPPEILVVTFTEAATLELRERIRQRLTEAAQFCRGQCEGDEFLQRLLGEGDSRQRLRHARMLQLAADWMDEAAIYTIHGWCNRMLRQHAFASGSLFDQELDAADPHLLAETVRDYWRRFYYPLNGQQVVAVSRFAATPEQLQVKVDRLLREHQAHWQHRQSPLNVDAPMEPAQVTARWADWESHRQQLDQQARRDWREQRQSLEQWLRQALEQKWLNGNSYPAKSFEQRLQAIADWAERDCDCDRKWLCGFAASRIKLNQKYLDQLPAFAAFAALDRLADHLDSEPDIGIDLSLHARHWIRTGYAERKRRLARLDYDDLLLQLDQALDDKGKGQRLADTIRTQYPLAMIDEFQDTDPLQYRIFSNVYQRRAGDDSGLLLIGDPKQAIYAFRGADIHTYLRAKREAEGQLYTLTRNFRSTEALVAAVNRVFVHAEQHDAGAFMFKVAGESNPLPYWSVQARGRDERFFVDGETPPALTCWLTTEPRTFSGKEYQALMAQVAASKIVELLNAAQQHRAGFQRGESMQPLKAADMAILVRNRHEAASVRAALSDRGLRSVYLSDQDSVFASREADDLLRWLQACAEPEQPRLLRAALASVSLDLSLRQLDDLNRDELAWEAEVERFKNLQDLWRRQGVLAMLRDLLKQYDLPGKLLSRDDGERRLTNLLHLSELLQRASLELDGEQALIRYLAEAIADGKADDDSLLRLESDSDLIKVVTLHKSKGLEYPLVFLPFICSFREITAKQGYFRYHGEDGELRIELGNDDAARQQADNERLQEDLRLLYVGLTRARHACWLGIAALKVGNSEKSQLHRSAMGYLLGGGEPIDAGELAVSLQRLRGDCTAIALAEPLVGEQMAAIATEAVDRLTARSVDAYRCRPWWIASYSALRLADSDDADAPETPRQANFGEEAYRQGRPASPAGVAGDRHGFPRGSQAGVFLHGLLETAAKQGFAQAANDDGRRRQWLAVACERRGWADWTDCLNRWLQRILMAPLALTQGECSLARLTQPGYQPELEFWFASRSVDARRLDNLVCGGILPGYPRPALQRQQLNGMLKGFIDLVFEHQGRYYLLDYKSNRLGDDDLAYREATLREEVLSHRYDLQGCLYLLALQRLLKARLGGDYDYRRHVGGMMFWFLRGIEAEGAGVYRLLPEQELIDALDDLFAGCELEHED